MMMKNREGKDSGDGYVWKVERMGKEWTVFPRGREFGYLF